MNKITSIALILLIPTYSFGGDIFPKTNKICTKIKAPCTSDPESTCIKTICDHDANKQILDSFLNKYQILGKKIDNIIEFERFISKNLPKDLKKYSQHFVSEEASLIEYEFAIVFILDKNSRIKTVKMF